MKKLLMLAFLAVASTSFVSLSGCGQPVDSAASSGAGSSPQEEDPAAYDKAQQKIKPK